MQGCGARLSENLDKKATAFLTFMKALDTESKRCVTL